MYQKTKDSSKGLSKRAKNTIIYSSVGIAIATALVVMTVLLLKKPSSGQTNINPNTTLAQPQVNGTWIPDRMMGSWSYYKASFNDPWNVEDFFFTDTDGKSYLWQNFILSDGYPSWDYYAQVWTQIYKRTGVKILAFWRPFQAAGGIVDEASLATYEQKYKELVAKYPDLPETPSGICLYDEPNPLGIMGDSTHWGIVTASQKLREKYPDTKLYCNFLYTTMTNTTYTQAMGASELDYISSDQYFDYSAGTYRNTYITYLYPYLKPTQKVLLLPYAAYKEAGCGPLDAVAADNYCLNSVAANANSYTAWMNLDTQWVVGMNIYRLKNLWWDNTTGASIMSNPSCTGLGLIDRVTPGGDYIMPGTVNFWQQMGKTFCNGVYDITK